MNIATLNNEVINLDQAELVMRRAGIVQDVMVEGKQLLAVCGLSLNSPAKEIKRQIEKHRFVEGADYRASMPENNGRGRPATIFHFTINAANDVLLAAMTPEGKNAR